ncbi:hypothetical protein L9F63_005349, partial [Diploptera punctata]
LEIINLAGLKKWHVMEVVPHMDIDIQRKQRPCLSNVLLQNKKNLLQFLSNNDLYRGTHRATRVNQCLNQPRV